MRVILGCCWLGSSSGIFTVLNIVCFGWGNKEVLWEEPGVVFVRSNVFAW